MNNNLDIVLSDEIKLIEKAYEYCCTSFSHEEILQALGNKDEIKKQLCVIQLKKIQNQEEANLLISNLINKGGPVREVVSAKINELFKEGTYANFFQTKEIIDFLVKAINDVNPSVSRNIVEIINHVQDKEYLKEKIYKKIFTLFDEIEELNGKKSHVVNKKSFNLYWCLETIYKILDKIEIDSSLEKILSLTTEYEEYPIREKAAKILSRINEKNAHLTNLIEILKQDCNMYVRRYLC